ncbi:protein translocase subunit SecDF [Chitinophagales bacterium]|nr:protein translocase subunit SecDF [Chitinophagales bacterium]
MQGKGLILTCAIAIILACLYALSFGFFTNKVESAALTYAKEKVQTLDVEATERETLLQQYRVAYLDSMEDKSITPWGSTYKTAKKSRLNKGLDLEGGYSAVLQVSLEGVIKALSGNNQSPDFLNAIDGAKELEKNSQEDFVTLFGQAYEKAAPGKSLAALFDIQENQASINAGSSDADVLDFIRSQGQEAIESTFDIIRTRIDKFGVASPNLSLQKERGRILVELPGIQDAERAEKLLVSEANLEFWEITEFTNTVYSWFQAADEGLRVANGYDEAKAEADKAEQIAEDLAGQLEEGEDSTSLEDGFEDTDGTDSDDSVELTEVERRAKFPFSSIVSPLGQIGSPYSAIVKVSDVPEFERLLTLPAVKAAIPRTAKLLLGKEEFELGENGEGGKARYVHVIESRTTDFTPRLDGGVITDAGSARQQTGEVEVTMRMNNEGAKIWKKMTGENVGQHVAVVLDDEVYSAPRVNGEIAGGSTSITGDFGIEEAQDLATVLKIGKLPAKAKIVESSRVGPTLGAASQSSGIWSLGIGLIIVLLFMAAYYAKSGIVSIVALILNLFLIIGILASVGAVLTLPGIAGIVLTIGMAVDANVIIYERIREELAKGKTRARAIADGFTHSYSAIIDANVTTLITAIILAWFGLGPVKGFATILIIGILTSLLTAVLLTRIGIDWAEDKGIAMSFSNFGDWFKNMGIDFVSRRKMNYIVSGLIIALGIASMASRGFELGVDFEGGRTYVVQMDQEVETEKVSAALNNVWQAVPTVTTYGTENQLKITTSYKIADRSDGVSAEIANQLHAGLSPFFANAPDVDTFKKETIQSSQMVGPTIADDITRAAFLATLLALMGIFLYIILRFRKWQYGMAAVVTIIHDTLILLSVFSLLHGILPFAMEINQAFIAALLTVIGYSINDTVVVFDRIREYLKDNKGKKNYLTVINDAINSTLSRTIITSLTTLFVVLVLFLFGGASMKGFAFALLLGIIVGTYSSIFIATPLVIDLASGEQTAGKVVTSTEFSAA